ncbi:MAG TPA: hypothetical protein VFG54_19490 [Prolixibacteraceae bacterium]|nr:hypothetical protein [Prolixibacteraceae bacterium]
MKLSFRSFTLILAMVWAGSLFFSSCKDENDDPAKPSKPLVASMTYYSEDGTLEEFESFRYDTKGLLMEMNTGDAYKVVFEYSPSTVTVKEYDEGELDYTSIFTLDNNGLCVSSTSDNGTVSYTYDANGYRKKSVEQDGSSTYTETYTVSNQNYVTITTENKYVSPESSQMRKSGNFGKSLFLKSLGKSRIVQNTLKSASDEISTYKTDYLFYTDKTNTIDFENMGIFFFGKQNNNPVKKEIETFSEGDGGTIEYSYEYDAKGRITRKTYSFGDYEVYTYVD